MSKQPQAEKFPTAAAIFIENTKLRPGTTYFGFKFFM